MGYIDSFLNRITMYRLVLYFLEILLVVAGIFGLFGILPYNPLAIAFSALFLLVLCWAVNLGLAKIYRTQVNSESAYITALILALIITPALPTDFGAVIFLFWAGVWAMASKYLLAIDKKHVFNPAAFAVALTGFTIHQYASWWVGGNLPLLGFVLAGGFLVIRKIQRFDLVLTYLAGAFGMIVITSFPYSAPLDTIQKIILHTPVFFFASIMLTEPLTTPPTRPLRIVYGALVGLIYDPAIHIGTIISSTPELALLAGNIFSYAVSPKGKRILALKEKREVGAGVYDFVFTPEKPLKFRPGQYLEWTLGHKHNDGRGNRRYFTIASSPTEKDLHLGVRFYEPSSTFKKALLAMAPGSTILAGQLAGDFTLPHDQHKKLVFIAGGIGITPFRSMVKYLSDQKEKRDAVLLYSSRTRREIAYAEIFDEAARTIGLKTIYVVNDESSNEQTRFIDAALIQKEIPDYKERMFYVSGPRSMVTAFEKILADMDIPLTHIKTDFFPGFA